MAQPAVWLSADERDLEGNDTTFSYSPIELPLPSETLRAAVSGPDLDHFMYIGSAWVDVCSRYLPVAERVDVLDVGCGVGKMARFFALNPALHYVGFDIHLPCIEWCKREFSRVYGNRFRFEHFDGHSSMYNPAGVVKVAEYKFPVSDNSMNLILGASVFTHLYEGDMRSYLQETYRSLCMGGVAVFSIHTPDEAEYFFPDCPAKNDKKIIGNEQVMLVDKEYFITMGQDAGLKVQDTLGRLCGQEIIVFKK